MTYRKADREVLKRVLRLAPLGLGLLLWTGCGAGEFPDSPALSAPAQPVCVTGQGVGCACADGSIGVAQCLPGGLGFSVCQCASTQVAGNPVLPGATGGQVPWGQGGGLVVPFSGGVMPAPSGGVVAPQSGGLVATGAVPSSGGEPAISGGMLNTGATVGSGGTGVGTGGVMPASGGMPQVVDTARDIRISEIAIYQVVKVSLSQAGQPVTERNAPVIVNKPALLRIFVAPLAGFVSREIAVELTLSSAAGPDASQTLRKTITAASSEASLGSTINFELPASAVTSDLRYAVTLRETLGGVGGSIDEGARFPAQAGSLVELGARDPGPHRVVFVPYRYLPDGSQRLPDVSATQVESYRRYLMHLYPLSDIQVEVRASVDNYSSVVNRSSGWDDLLDHVCNLRAQESRDSRVYYYGLISPASGLRDYGSGVVGISYAPSASSSYGRCSVGIGFGGTVSALTMAHEMGHALGLPHAPCGVQGAAFPYAEARIGSWGYDTLTSTLKEPSRHYDMMSYCDPTFISDYNYEKIFERVRYVNTQAKRTDLALAAVSYHRILQLPDGQLKVVGKHEGQEPPTGPESAHEVELISAQGASLGFVQGFFLRTGEGESGVWFVPEQAGATVAVLGQAGAVVLP